MSSNHIHISTSLQVALIVGLFASALSPLLARTATDPNEQLTISRARIIAHATLAYAFDNDRVLPLAMSFNTLGNQWRMNAFDCVPVGWTSTGHRDAPPRTLEDSSTVLNAIQPYVGATSTYAAAGVPDYNPGFEASQLRLQRSTSIVGFDYNGFLHAWPLDAVTTPERLPMYHQNYGQNTVGATLPIVALCCTNLGPECRFNPRGYPQGVNSCAYGQRYGYVWFMPTSKDNFTVWIYGHQMVMASVDGTAKSETYDAPIWPTYSLNVGVSPWSSISGPNTGYPEGSPYWLTDCVQPGGSKPFPIFYAGYFRPDSEFNYTLQQCDFGGG